MCDWYGIGCPPPTKSEILIDNSLINKAVVEVLNTNMSDAKQTAMTTQSINLSKAKITGCALDLTQTSAVNLQAMQNISSDVSSELVNTIQQNIAQQLDQQTQATAGFLSQPTAAQSIANVKTSLTNELGTSLSTENINKIIQKVNQTQTIEAESFTFDQCNSGLLVTAPALAQTAIGTAIASCITNPKPPPCNVGQLTTSNLVATQITNTVMGVISNNEALQVLNQQITQNTSSESTGLFQDLFNGIANVFSSIGGMYASSISLSCIICCCCCIILLVVGVGAAAVPPGNAGAAANNGGSVNSGYNNGGGGVYNNRIN